MNAPATQTKPPMAYYGGKTRLAERIAALLPPHEHYVEPFAGSLAVLLAKEPSRMETVNDLDELLMTFWRVLRDRPDELARACALTPHSRAEYSAARETDLEALPELERARLVWVMISQGRAGTLRSTGWRSYVDPAGSRTSMPGYLDAYVHRMAIAAERLHGVSLECRPAIEVVEQYGSIPGCCLYVDPPYLGATRSNGGGGYRLEMKSGVDHDELLDALSLCRSTVLVSGYASDLYDARLATWTRIEIPASTGQGKKRSARTEVVWANRPLSQQGSFNFHESAS